jgi:hypothetical protein
MRVISRSRPFYASAVLSLGLLIITIAVQAGTPYAQDDYQEIIFELEERLRATDKEALRDLVPLLDRDDAVVIERYDGSSHTASVRKFALGMLAAFCSFDGLKIDEKLSAETYQLFLTESWDAIVYEDLIDAFTDRSLQDRRYEYQLRVPRIEEGKQQQLAYHRQELARSVSEQRWYPVVKEIEAIGKLGTPEAYQFLIECMRGEHWAPDANTRQNQVYSAIAYSLGSYESLAAARLILDILGEHQVYSVSDCVNALSKITNNDPVYFEKVKRVKDIRAAYLDLLEQYPSLEELRQAGFRRAGFELKDHGSRFELYRAVLFASENMWWLRYNAMQELLRLHDPRALPLVASLLIKRTYVYNEYLGRPQLLPVDEIRRVTGVDVAVRDASGAWTTSYNDEVSRLNYLVYWVLYFSDWSWDSERSIFTNGRDQIGAASRYDTLYERLFSKNGEQAMSAYIELTQGEPDQVISRLSQYPLKNPFGPRTLHSSLPLFAAKFLRQLVQLTAYCRDQGLIFEPSRDLEEKLDLLAGDLSFIQRYELENRIIAEAGLDDLTPLEYYGALYGSRNRELSRSIGRLLDKLYARSWHLIVSEPRQLELYRAKAEILDGLGTAGTCNDYMRRLGQTSAAGKSSDQGSGLDELLTALAQGSEVPEGEIDLEPTRDSYRRIVDVIQGTSDEVTLTRLVELLLFNLSVEMVPELFRIIEMPQVIHHGTISRHDTEMRDHGISFEVTVADVVVVLLERIYEHSFPVPADPDLGVDFVSGSHSGWAGFRNHGTTASQWLELWQSDGDSFRDWKQHFLSEALAEIEESQSVSAEQANQFWQLLQGTRGARERWLKVVERLDPDTELDELTIEASLQPENLTTFDNLKVTPDGLTKLINQVGFDRVKEVQTQAVTRDAGTPGTVLLFLEQTVAALPRSERGQSWYKLMWNTNLAEWLAGADPVVQRIRKTIGKELSRYNKRARSGSFQAVHSARFLVELELMEAGASFAERLARARRVEDAKVRSSLLENILEVLEYRDAGVALRQIELLQEAGSWRVRDAFNKIGIPLLELDTAWIAQILSEYQRLASIDLYRNILLRFDQQLFDARGNPDYNRVCEMLSFDIVKGFVGSNGPARADNVYPLIRWLEEAHSTSFGALDSDLQDNAEKWIAYLLAKGLAEPGCFLGR